MNLPIKKGAVLIIDDADADLVVTYDWEQIATGHVAATVHTGQGIHVVLLHRLLCEAPPGWLVCHDNNDKLDNRRENLVPSRRLNPRFHRSVLNKNNSSGVRGVQYAPKLSPGKPWRAQIGAEGHNYHLGMYANREEAIAVRRAAELCVFGETCG